MVERFDLNEGGFLGERGHMEADPTGDYVRYSDYADLVYRHNTAFHSASNIAAAIRALSQESKP